MATSTEGRFQNVAIKVNMSVPVHLTAKDTERYPEMVKLLTSLSQHVTEDGISTQVQAEKQQAEEAMRKDKADYFQYHILHHELQELLIDHDISCEEMVPSSQAMQFYTAVKKCLYTAEACDYLHPIPGKEEGQPPVTLLDLTKEKMNRANVHARGLQALQQQLIPRLEERLRKKCEELEAFHHPPNSTEGSDDLAFARATRLPDLLQSECTELVEKKTKLRLDRAKRDKQFWHYYQALMECLEVLEKLINRHRLGLQADSDSITSDWLSARCHALCLKIKVFEAKLLCETYTPDVVSALKQIRHHLNLAIQEREKDVSRLQRALQAYESVGMGFDALVKEYEQLQGAIDNKKWALTELKQSMAPEEMTDWKT
ncbi:HAUS augmin-like complex subunit 4 [Amphiura filiformis]|uniref:HAUS augmin-like complex subunit 4 n=1 Tax=Amphiura filiformis TaxID=82378 RepID=UPI003B21A620